MTDVGAAVHRRVHHRRVERLAALIGALVPENAVVVDVGSGDGLLAARLLAARPDLSIRGFDVLARNATHVPVDLFDGTHIPVADAGCDVALLVDVLHHTDDPGPLLREAARIAARCVIVKDHLREGFAAETTLRFMDRVGNARHGVRLTYNYLTRDAWQSVLTTSGLRAEQWEEHLRLYPPPADWLFGRRLHFLASLVPVAR